MRRYGIRRERRLVTPGGSSYLNSISVGGVEYGVPREAGINEVIALPERALSKMIALEQMWLVARNYDPRTTQVKRVEFGVVQQSEGKWDLGIVDIEVQDLRGILGGDRQ
ncbi:hypothetical protein HQ520_09915 [bacterium]|nr:hypothetical protein [bacterium]